MTWLSRGIIDDLGATAAAHEAAAEKAGEAFETHRKAAFAAREDLHRHRGLAAEAKFLLTIAHGAAPVPSPGQIREVDDERDGLGLAIGNLRIALPPDAPPDQFGRMAESMRALYAAAHVVALHADERSRAGSPGPPAPPPVPEPEGPAPVPRAYASLVGSRVRVDGTDGSSHVGVLNSVEGGQITLLDPDGVPVAWPLLDDVVSVQPVPAAEDGDVPAQVPPDGSRSGPPPAAFVSLIRRGSGPRRTPEDAR